MSTTYSPDVAPDLEPAVVHWQPRHKTPDQRAAHTRIVISAGAVAVLGLAAGAVAIVLLSMRRSQAGGPRPRRLAELGVERLRRLRRAF